MFEKRDIFLYNQFEMKVNLITLAYAVLTAPLSSFHHKDTATSGNARNLTHSDIGKKFNVNFFDLYEFGKAEFLGFGIKLLPESVLEEIEFFGHEDDFKEWCVFKNSHNFIAIKPSNCDAHSL